MIISRIFSQIIVGILGIYLAVLFVPGVNISTGEFTREGIKILIIIGTVFGLINFFIKPIINFITLPLRIVTLGLFGLVVNIAMIWIVDKIFIELTVSNFSALFWTSIIVWVLSCMIPTNKYRRSRKLL
ncbi:phage holin family protein [Candidatus Atribacteria bacterium MT.SAG.1]|nr:phage holin family protein [Candidatus Atribacteria bacterium MT.SAG.1]